MITALPKTPVMPEYDKLPEGEIILINGLPKTGKTTFVASWPDNCIVEVERSGAKWIKGAMVIEPTNTDDVIQILKLLKSDGGRFGAVTLDTVDSLSLWIEKDICNKYKVSCISMAGGGYGIGRNELNTRLISIIDDFVALGKTLLIISHCRDDKGSKSLLLTETLLTYIQGKASIIGYAYKELKGNEIDYLIDWGGQGTVVAGSRHPRFARAGILPNTYQAVLDLFKPKPATWDKMLSWYSKHEVNLAGYGAFVEEKYGKGVIIETLMPSEVKELIALGTGHSKNDKEFKAFHKKYGSPDVK